MTGRDGRAGSPRSRLVSASFVVTVVLLLVGASTAATVAVLRAPRPVALAEAQPLATVPVQQREFADPRAVRVETSLGDAEPVLTRASGTVTALDCTAGGTLSSGERVLEVDGAPIVGLAARVPLWRDLAVGDHGEDVLAVQQELARLGYSPGDSGRVDRATVNAVRRFAQDTGVTLPRGGSLLPLSAVVWLPGPTVETESCDLVRGATVAPGDEVGRTRAPLVRAVATLPPGLVAGARSLIVDGVTVEVDADGLISAPEALAVLAATDSARSAQAVEESGFTGELALRTPLVVLSVPTSALYGEDATGTACLLADDVAREVRVVSSELGQTLVTMADASVPSPVEVTVAVPDRGASCGSS